MNTYLETAKNVYKEAALKPDVGLCCTTTPIWQFPELEIPKKMLDMNYGCGNTVNPRDLINNPSILYIGIGGGMELLQFSYFSRNPGAIIGVDPVEEMIDVCATNLLDAENSNSWFKKEFVNLKNGTALDLPIESETIDIVAQNCLFNIFNSQDLIQALNEVYRVLKPHGRLVLSDPVCGQSMPENLKNNEKLRALCLSGALPLKEYLKVITAAGFGTVEIRAKRPYRILDTKNYDTYELIYIESVEVCAIKDPMPKDGSCIFTGKSAIYFGDKEYFDDKAGHIMVKNQPLAICDKTANAIKNLNRDDIFISESTYHYDGGGCC